MRQACLPANCVGGPVIQPQESSRLVISLIVLKTEHISEVESFGSIPPSEPKDLEACEVLLSEMMKEEGYNETR